MKSTITFSKEDEDLLLVSMKFVFDESRDLTLRKRLAALHIKPSPMKQTKIPISGVAYLTGESNTSIHNEFVIQRIYEIPMDYDQNEALVKAHAEKYYARVTEELKNIP